MPNNGTAQLKFQEVNYFELPTDAFSVQITDIDSDSDPDFIFISKDSLLYPNSLIYENVGGSFVSHDIGSIFIDYCNIAFADLDSDGDRDLLLSGINPSTKLPLSKIFYFSNFSLQGSSSELYGVYGMQNSIGDIDLDGDLDIIIGGSTQFDGSNQQNITRLYLNQNGTFIESTVQLKGYRDGEINIIDLENDGDNDILIYGKSGTQIRIYENQSGAFQSVANSIPQMQLSIVKFIDVDNDGYKDLFLVGTESEQGMVRIIFYKNNQNTFEEINNEFIPALNGDIICEDIDNDGTKELLISGQTETGFITVVYNISGLEFSLIENDLPGIINGKITITDIESDGINEVVVSGYNSSNYKILKIYKNTL